MLALEYPIFSDTYFTLSPNSKQRLIASNLILIGGFLGCLLELMIIGSFFLFFCGIFFLKNPLIEIFSCRIS